jgi:orotate phosphoribosyltransferase
MSMELAVLIVGVAFAACPVAMAVIRRSKENGNGKVCSLHATMEREREKDQDEFWGAIKEMRGDIKILLQRTAKL